MMARLSRGSVMLLVIVFGAIFLTLLLGLAGYILSLGRAQDYLYEKAEASAISEAGVSYYRWYLGQYPSDTAPLSPSTFTYTDVSGAAIGTYALSITPDTGCPGSTAYDLSSLGAPADAPSVHTTISLVYVPAGGTYARAPGCTALATTTSAQFLDWQEQ
jgi:hypothetical protein